MRIYVYTDILCVNFALSPFALSVASCDGGGTYQLLSIDDPCEIYMWNSQSQSGRCFLEVLSVSAFDIGALDRQGRGEVSGVIWAALGDGNCA